MNRISKRLGLAGLGLIACAVAHAQTATTGSVQGTVVDSAGAPVTGATVRLGSAQVARTVITGSDGRFQLGLLNAGSWQVTVTKTGFVSVNQSISVSINESRTLNLKLAKEGGATVEVVGSASSVDATSTSTGMNISTDELRTLPVGRSVNDYVFLSPGVTGGGTTFNNQGPGLGVSINGGSGAENTWIVDGLVTNDFRYGGTGTNLSPEFIESVDIQTGGYKPEFSALGGVFSVVTKSGSNQFRGSAWGNFEPYGPQAVNKKNGYFNQAALFATPPVRDLTQSGSSAARKTLEVGATAGGAILPDRFFYFVGVNGLISDAPGFANFSGTPVGSRSQNDYSLTTKFNYYVNPDQQLTVSYFGNRKVDDAPDDRPALYGDARTGFKHSVSSDNLSMVFDWTLRSDLLLSIKGGVAKINDKLEVANDLPQINDSHWYNGGGGGTGSYVQQKNPYVRGGFGRYNPNDRGETKQLKADLSWFLTSHNLKFGLSTLASDYHRTAATSGGFWYIIRAAGDRLDRRRQTDDSIVKAQFDALYAQDTWDIGHGLRVFYGLRYERQIQKDANGNTFLKFDSFGDYTQPRLGFTWDVNNDGRTKLSGSFARYFEQIPQRLAARVYGHEVYYRERWQNSPGQQDKFIYSSTGTGTVIGTRTGYTDFAGPYSFDPLAEGTKLPRRTEWILGFEHTLDSGYTLGIHGKYRNFDNILEDSVIRGKGGDPMVAYDPEERAILWNPGHYAAWTTQTGEHYVTNTAPFDPAKNIYTSLDFTFEKRTEHYYLNFSYTWSRLEGNYEGLITSSNGQADASITASWDEWPYVGYGLLPLDRTHVVKLLVSRNWTLGPGLLNLGFNWVYQSGTPLSLFDDGSTTLGKAPGTDPSLDVGGYGNAIPANFKLGQYGRTPATNVVDMRVDYTWAITPKLKLTPTFEVFNLFNTRPATRSLEQATDAAGNPEARYGESTDWLRGRHFRFGAKLVF